MSIAFYLLLGALVSATITVVVLRAARRRAQRDEAARLTRVLHATMRERDREAPILPKIYRPSLETQRAQLQAQQARLRNTVAARERVRDYGLSDHTFWSTTILEAPIQPTPVDCTPSTNVESGGSDSGGGCDSGSSGSSD